MEMVGLARHNLKNTWLLCKPTSNSQVKKKPRYKNDFFFKKGKVKNELRSSTKIQSVVR